MPEYWFEPTDTHFINTQFFLMDQLTNIYTQLLAAKYVHGKSIVGRKKGFL